MTRRQCEHRLDWRPLERLARVGRPNASPQELADIVGTTRRNIYRWRTLGMLPATADTASIRLGFHPAEVWGDAWFGISEERDRRTRIRKQQDTARRTATRRQEMA